MNCGYCGGALPLNRQAHCGNADCKRAYNNERQKRFYAKHREETGENYRRRYSRGSRGTSEGKRSRDRRYWSNRRRILREVAVAEVVPAEIFERDRWTCGICGKRVRRSAQAPHPKAPVIDHVIPLAAGADNGGVDAPWNVQCAHFLCNSIKQADWVAAALF